MIEYEGIEVLLKKETALREKDKYYSRTRSRWEDIPELLIGKKSVCAKAPVKRTIKGNYAVLLGLTPKNTDAINYIGKSFI